MYEKEVTECKEFPPPPEGVLSQHEVLEALAIRLVISFLDLISSRELPTGTLTAEAINATVIKGRIYVSNELIFAVDVSGEAEVPNTERSTLLKYTYGLIPHVLHAILDVWCLQHFNAACLLASTVSVSQLNTFFFSFSGTQRVW